MDNFINAVKDARIEAMRKLLDLPKDSTHSERTALEELDAMLKNVINCYRTGEWKAKENGEKDKEGEESES